MGDPWVLPAVHIILHAVCCDDPVADPRPPGVATTERAPGAETCVGDRPWTVS
jgi:hypothetical protein